MVVIEGVECFVDPFTGEESSLKFWLPRVFPPRVKFVLTASPGSKAARYLRDQGCLSIKIRSDRATIGSVVQNTTQQMEKYLVGPQHVSRLKDLLVRKLKDEAFDVKMIYVKSMVGLLAPKTNQQIEDVVQEREFFTSVYSQVNWKLLEGRILL